MFAGLSRTSVIGTLGRHRLPEISVLIALLIFALAPLTALAQTGQGSMSGRVSDAKDAAIVGAEVVITQTDTHVVNSTITNGSGIYNVESLNPGTYTVAFSARGFSRLVTDKVLVSAAAAVEVNGNLRVGGATETVTVTATSELLSNASDVSTTIDEKIVESLPYPERSSLEAVLLVPGVVGDMLNPGGIGPENPNAFTNYFSPGASISIGGAAPGTSAIIIDGSDVTEASFPRAGMNLSGKVVQETTVIVAGASAQYGRMSGGAIVEVSRPGTSHYHGGVTWRHTDPKFWAISPGQSTKTNQHEHFYGFYLGGPVRIPKLYDRADKTFFFVGVEPARIHQMNGATRASFFTPAELAGQFHDSLDILNQSVLKTSGWAAALAAPRIGGVGYNAPHGGSPSDPSGLFPYGAAYTSNGLNQQINGPLSDCTAAGITQADFAGGATVCHDDLSAILAKNPFAQFVISNMPTPSNPGPYITFDHPDGSAASDLTNGTMKRGVVNVDNRYSIRIDHHFNNSNQMYVRYTNVPISAGRIFAVSADNPINQTPTDVEHGYDISVGYTHVFSNVLVNDVHYSWFRERLQRLPPASAQTTDFGAKYGLVPAVAGFGFPTLGSFTSNGAQYTIQPGAGGFSQQIDQNFVLGDDLTLLHGSHALSFGFDLRWIQSNQYDLSGLAGGKYGFSAGASQAPNGQATPVVGGGSAFATFLLGISNYSNSPVQVPGYYRYKYWGAYIQDNWRATPKLTLNLGLRYEVQVPRTEAHDNQGFVSADPIAGTLNGLPTTTGFCFSGSCGLQRSLWPTNYWGIEPRLGIAYAMTPKMTLHASYSISRPPLSGQENIPDPNFNVSGSSSATNSAFITDYISNPIAPSSLVSAYTQLNGARGPFNFSTGLGPVFVDQTTAVPNVQIYNATVQYQPFSKTLVQATYQGLRGEHLYGQFVSKNTPSLSSLVNAIRSTAYLGATNPNTYGILSSNNASGTVMLETGSQALAPYQNFFNQGLTDVYARTGDSHYNGLYLSVNQRATKTLTLLANYSWSKSLDNVPDINAGAGAGSGQTSLQTPFSLGKEYAVSSFDQDSSFKAGYNLVLPIGIGQQFKTGNGFVDRLIGNISTSGFATAIVGYPSYVQLGNAGYFYSIQQQGASGTINGNNYACPVNPSNAQYCVTSVLPSGYTLRPDIVPGVPKILKNWRTNPYNSLAPGGITGYLNPAAFAVPGSYNNPTLGNAPRTMADARSPRNFFFDMGFSKGFTIRESYQLKLTCNLNNAFNHPSYFAPSHTAYSAPAISNPAKWTPGNPSSIPASSVLSYANSGTTIYRLGNAGAQVSARVIRVGAEFTF